MITYLRYSASLVILLFAFATQGGCQNKAGSDADNSSTQTKSEMNKKSSLSRGLEPLEDAQSSQEMDTQGRDEPLGVQTITGKLVSSKGNMAMIGSTMLDVDEVFEEHSRQWKPKYAALKDKTVTVTGEVVRHWCGPHEQCLSQGYIDHMREIQDIRKGR